MSTPTREPVLGRTVSGTLAADDLDLWQRPPGVIEVHIVSQEVQALCPVTGQPDLYDVAITYHPAQSIVESKALKMYLVGFRDQQVGAEALTSTIALDLSRVLDCWVEVRSEQQVRGGLRIGTTASAVCGQP